MTLILIGIIILSMILIIVAATKDFDGLGMLGVTTGLFALFFLFFALLDLCFVSYEFEKFQAQRDAFEMSLHESRNNGNQYETAAIAQEVAEWNVELASAKFRNSTFLFDWHVDDRIEDLEPIK